MNYQDINAETIDRWVKEGWEWGKAIGHDTFQAAKEGRSGRSSMSRTAGLVTYTDKKFLA